VVTAKVTYPTDLGLLARAVDKLHTTATRVQAAGGATRTRVRDRRRAVRRRAHQVARAMRSRTDQAKQVVFEVTGQVARLAEAQLADPAGSWPVPAGPWLVAAPGPPVGCGRWRSSRPPSGGPSGCSTSQHPPCRRDAGWASRLVSLHDPDARPIRKGRIGRPVEFGYKAQILDNPDGIVLDHPVMVGNPPDAPLLAPPSDGSSPTPAGCQER
jgi:transposase, IS5 family